MRLYALHCWMGLTVSLFALGLAAGIAPPSFAQTPTIFQSFTGTTFDQAGDGVPPDTMGAMGVNNQFSEFINGSFANFNTTTGSLVSRVSDTTFWQNAGISSATLSDGLSDPRIVFDAASQRWFASEITVPATSNAYLVAVSNSANLAGGFKGYTFQANPTSGSQNLFADFDMLGVNGDGVYLAASNFDPNGNNTSSSILAISKAGLISETAAPANHLFYANDPNGTGYLPHPVTDLESPQGTGKEYFLSNYDENTVSLSTLTGAGANPASETLTAPGGNVTIQSNPEPNNASQAGTTNVIQTNDSRFSGP